MDALWLRGGFPKSLLAASEPASLRWRKEFVRSYLPGKASPCIRSYDA